MKISGKVIGGMMVSAVALAAMGGAVQTARAAISYNVTNISTIPASNTAGFVADRTGGISPSGLVVGNGNTGTPAYEYIYNPATGTVNTVITPVNISVAGVNDSGYVAITSNALPVLTNGVTTTSIPLTNSKTTGSAKAINASNVVTGTSGGANSTGSHAYVYSGGSTSVDLVPLTAGTISDGDGVDAAGNVAGWSGVSSTGSTHTAVLWLADSQSAPVALSPTGYQTVGISDTGGYVAATASASGSPSLLYQFAETSPGVISTTSTTLALPTDKVITNLFLTGVNSSGDVVGDGAYTGGGRDGYVWTPTGGWTNLNNVVSSSYHVTIAEAINDNGWIAAYGYLTSDSSKTEISLLLIPTPEPTSLAFLALGAVATLKRRSRRA